MKKVTDDHIAQQRIQQEQEAIKKLQEEQEVRRMIMLKQIKEQAEK